ncbi:uncharacterized protein C18orf63 homolog [Erinaceus europaeus]|uniref:Uncharacterized protein C18orf63 homolog n=1 Tax=Erinaceus europaeus TaxID=9365 RepID=A0ABM3W0C6_ERIEU|nr:uncharacterized protein C18orf63 homolog [Erinaceus europaeus]
MSSQRQQSLFFVDSPDLQKLCAVRVTIPSAGKPEPEVRTVQLKMSRHLLLLHREVLTAPFPQAVSQLWVVTTIPFYKTGKISAFLEQYGAKMEAPQKVVPAILQDCLTHSLTTRLAPSWNRTGHLLVQGRGFLSRMGKQNAVVLDISVTETQICLSVEVYTIRLPPPELREFAISPNVIKDFHTNEEATIEGHSILNNWCYVLPSMKMGQISNIVHKMPPECPFKSYEELQIHWNDMYGYKLPEDAGNFQIYCSVYFKMVGQRIFTYPLSCIRTQPVQFFPRIDLEGVLKSFAADLRIKLPHICGLPVKMTDNPCFHTYKLTRPCVLENQHTPPNLVTHITFTPAHMRAPSARSDSAPGLPPSSATSDHKVAPSASQTGPAQSRKKSLSGSASQAREEVFFIPHRRNTHGQDTHSRHSKAGVSSTLLLPPGFPHSKKRSLSSKAKHMELPVAHRAKIQTPDRHSIHRKHNVFSNPLLSSASAHSRKRSSSHKAPHVHVEEPLTPRGDTQAQDTHSSHLESSESPVVVLPPESPESRNNSLASVEVSRPHRENTNVEDTDFSQPQPGTSSTLLLSPGSAQNRENSFSNLAPQVHVEEPAPHRGNTQVQDTQVSPQRDNVPRFMSAFKNQLLRRSKILLGQKLKKPVARESQLASTQTIVIHDDPPDADSNREDQSDEAVQINPPDVDSDTDQSDENVQLNDGHLNQTSRPPQERIAKPCESVTEDSPSNETALTVNGAESQLQPGSTTEDAGDLQVNGNSTSKYKEKGRERLRVKRQPQGSETEMRNPQQLKQKPVNQTQEVGICDHRTAHRSKRKLCEESSKVSKKLHFKCASHEQQQASCGRNQTHDLTKSKSKKCHSSQSLEHGCERTSPPEEEPDQSAVLRTEDTSEDSDSS